MPAIEITDAQAKALARGENITIAPEREELHNVILFIGSQVYFVWDGYIEGDKVYTSRRQRFVNSFGEPVTEPVTEPVSNGSEYFSERSKIKRIVWVGA